MKKEDIVRQLYEIAEVLEPLTHDISKNTLMWNGKDYTKSNVEQKPNPYVLAWWCVFTNLAGFIDSQDFPLAVKQVDFLHKLFLGGMGSFNDFTFSIHELGDIAQSMNKTLDKKREKLYSLLK